MFSTSRAGIVSTNKQGARCAPTGQCAFLLCFSGFLPHFGLVLDPACGNGRKTLFIARAALAAAGCYSSKTALEWGREAATRTRLKVFFVQADLTGFTLPANSFPVVACLKYRNPEHYPSMRAALSVGGALISETYNLEYALSGVKPGMRRTIWSELAGHSANGR